MYEKLVSNLRERAAWINFPRHGEEYPSGDSKLMTDAADAIEELQAGEKKFLRNISAIEMENENLKRARRWIPVTERLPENKEMVLCFTPVDGYMFVGFHFSYKWGSSTVSKWRIITAMRSTKDITKKVSHWMPLPEAPKEET